MKDNAQLFPSDVCASTWGFVLIESNFHGTTCTFVVLVSESLMFWQRIFVVDLRSELSCWWEASGHVLRELGAHTDSQMHTTGHAERPISTRMA
jgi:hypothetical protein